MENATIEYSSESLCASMFVFVFVCVCFDNSKRNRCRNTKLEYAVVYENISDEFYIGLRRFKVKVTVGVQKFPHLPQYNCKDLYFNFGTSLEAYIKPVCSSDTNIQNL